MNYQINNPSHSQNDDHFNSDGQPHNIFIPKQTLLKKFKLTIKLVDDLIYQIYLGLIGNFDTTINDMEIPDVLKNILHSRQILFFYIFLGNFWMIYSNITMEKKIILDGNETSNYELHLYYTKCILYLTCMITFGVSLLFVLNLKFKNFSQMKIQRYNELEQYILSKNKELKKNICTHCNVVRCMRSFHCNYCNKCVSKFELHSNWFNTCIGSQNVLIYSLILIFLNLFLFFCIMNYSLQVFFIDKNSLLYDFKSNIFYLHFWFSITFYLEFKLFSYTYRIIKGSLFSNLTENERKNWVRLPYLWKDASKEFFNPFDRGSWNNLKDVLASWSNKEVEISDRINTELMKNPNLNGNADMIEINKVKSSEKNTSIVNSNEDDFVFLNDEGNTEKKEDISISKTTREFEDKMQLDYFLTTDRKIFYQTYDPSYIKKPINWNKIRLYTILDLINSPFRKILHKNSLFIEK